MTKSTITREQLEEWVAQFDDDGGCDATDRQLEALIRQSLAAMDQEPALHRYRRKAVEPYGPYPWHYEVFVDYPRPVEGIEDEYFYAAPPVVTGFSVDSEPVKNHIGSKNALDAIVSFIKSKSNPTVKCYDEVSEQLFKDNCHAIHSHVIEYILKLGEELECLRAEQSEMQPAPVVPDDVSIFEAAIEECKKCDSIDEHAWNHGVLAVIAKYESCRAAILQAGNSPANPDGLPDGVNIYHGPKEKTILVLKQGVAVNPDCWCRTCRPVTLNDMRFVVCPDCGNKRCPRANDHRNACTGSNEHGQEGSAYPDAPREVK